MPLNNFLPKHPLEIRVVDLVQDDSIVTQVARVRGWRVVTDDETDETSVEVYTRASYYTLKNGAVGAKLAPGKGPAPYDVTLTANNNSACYFNTQDPADPRNGQVLYVRSGSVYQMPDGGGLPVFAWERLGADGSREVVGYDLSDAVDAAPLELQGNIFEQMLDQPLVLRQLLAYHVQAANGPQFRRYGSGPE